MRLTVNREALGEFCRQRGIARLELFGSACQKNEHENDIYRSVSQVP